MTPNPREWVPEGWAPGEWVPEELSARGILRTVFVAMVAVTLLSAGHSYLTHDAVASEPGADGAAGTVAGEPVIVATIDGVGPGQIVAYTRNGTVAYQEDLWLGHDVDPSPEGEYTVEYVASEPGDADECDADECLRNYITRANLSTGESERLLEWGVPRSGSSQTHDVDRVNESVFLVAQISYPDRVYMVNVTTGEEIWEWHVSEAFEPESGGRYPSDWTHINDVEYLDDGRIMANLRNQDQVVFIEPGEGVQEEWTLGVDDDHETLYEPHNPDYIPEERGGPAVVVADSENNRLVEYQREDGTWERTWTWQDTELQWPRDADRLPSGRTLVADSHGQRIVSLAADGSIAWSKSFPTGSYDVELLGSGDESDGGHSAATLELGSRSGFDRVDDGNTSIRHATVGGGDDVSSGPPAGAGGAAEGKQAIDPTGTLSVLTYRVASLVPPLVLHGLLYTLPAWATTGDAVLLLATLLVGLTWGGLTGARRLARRYDVALSQVLQWRRGRK